jgi:hypothetical protein
MEYLKLSSDIINIIDRYVRLTTKFLLKMENELYNKYESLTLVINSLDGNRILGLFTTNEKAVRYMIRYNIKYIIYNDYVERRDFKYYIEEQIYWCNESININWLYKNKPIYAKVNKNGTICGEPHDYLTQIKCSDNFCLVEIDPVINDFRF